MIEFVDIYKKLNHHSVLKGISFKIKPCSVHMIIGASGVGKSVLMKMVVGLMQPDTGQVLLDQEPINNQPESFYLRIRKKCGMVLQHAALLDSMDVKDNMIAPLMSVHAWSYHAAKKRAVQALEDVGIASTLYQKKPYELSEGIKKRIAIARALALQPSYLIYDEPTTALDPESARKIDALIKHTSQAQHMTSIVISHDKMSVWSIADNITLLAHGEVAFNGDKNAFYKSTQDVIKPYQYCFGHKLNT